MAARGAVRPIDFSIDLATALCQARYLAFESYSGVPYVPYVVYKEAMGPARLVWGPRRGGEGDTGLSGSLPILPLPSFFASAASCAPQSFLPALPLKIASVIARSKS